jgi:hypothetical protein
MTRKSKREIEHVIDDLGSSDVDDDTVSVVFRDAATDEYYSGQDLTEPVKDPDALPGITVVISRGVVVMSRKRAEREGREILGPAENTPLGVDAVRVARDD